MVQNQESSCRSLLKGIWKIASTSIGRKNCLNLSSFKDGDVASINSATRFGATFERQAIGPSIPSLGTAAHSLDQ
jgi:hypothetical protein